MKNKQNFLFEGISFSKYYRFWNSVDDTLRKNSIMQIEFFQKPTALNLMKRWKLKKYELMKTHCQIITSKNHILLKKEAKTLKENIKGDNEA